LTTRLILLLTGIVIGLTTYYRWCGGEFRRPLQIDETISLQEYTWAGVEPSGERHHLRRIQDLHALQRPSLSQAVMALFCSLGRWTEPNNHIINSLLMNVSIAWGSPHEGNVRLPALLGAVVFSVLLIPAAYRFTDSWLVIPPLIFCVLWHPYLLRFSVEARGYTWMLALQAASLLTFTYLVERPRSICLGAASALLSILTFMNVVSLAIDWVLPFYLSALLIPIEQRPSEQLGQYAERRALMRRNLAVQLLAVISIGLVFLVDRLPAVIVSARRYGTPFRRPDQVLASLARIIQELFPTLPWKLVAVLGLLGVICSGRSAPRRWLRAFMAMTLLVSMTHFLLTRRLPYARVCGYLLPFLFLGLANMARLALQRGRTKPVRAALWSGLATGAVMVAAPCFYTELHMDITSLSNVARRMEQPSGLPIMALVVPDSLAESLSLYLPPRWLSKYDRLPTSGEVELEIIEMDRLTIPRDVTPGSPTAGIWRPRGRQVARRTFASGSLRMTSISGSTERFSGVLAGTVGGRALVFWYPELSSVAVTPGRVLDFVGRSGLRHIDCYVRCQMKLNVFVILKSIIFIADSPGECEILASAVSSGINRFGGEAVVFLPRGDED
jgi:hypothetical protein